ncbi:MAG: hypothetical protein V4710_09210 [Verrucomicrobiota bacterium]
MNAMSHNSGPRANAYSKNKFTNRRYYDPFALEVASAFKRFDHKIPENPQNPWIITLPPHPQFLQPCGHGEIDQKIQHIPKSYIEGLRAIFVLSGTNRQLRCWKGNLCCYGWYWRECIFLHAHPKDSIREYFLNHVLLHEIGHHVDRFRVTDNKTSEGYADWFAVQNSKAPGAMVD